MIPTKIDSTFIMTINEKGIESVVHWFEQHKHSLYALGRFYLTHQQQIEELFYQTILNVHKEWPRLKHDTSFDMWVTSLFIQNCRELSRDHGPQGGEENDSRPELLQAFDQLKEDEKEAMILRYVKGSSQEEAAKILQISEDQIKGHLFSGIRSLREQTESGESFNGCIEYHKNYIDYLERTMERPKRVDFEIHIYHCEKCQEDLATFQDVRLSLLNHTDRMEDVHVPPGFMENVKGRLVERENQRRQKNKKRKKVGVVFASIFTVLMGIGFLTGFFPNLYYTWTEEDEQLRTFLQRDLGQRVNLEAESDGVIVKIKGVVADDIQTLVFYEIEDTNEDNQYFMNYDDGVIVENRYKIMNHDTYPKYFPPDLESEVNKRQKNVFQGKISLLPLNTDNETIHLKINKLLKIDRASSVADQYWGYGNNQYQTGEWNFEIPVTKQSSTEYALSGQTEIEGIPVRFEKLIVAPTATSLQYSINREQTEKRVDFLNFDNLGVNDKILKVDMFGGVPMNTQQDMNWYTFQAQFDTLIGETPKDISVQFTSAYLTYEDDKRIPLDVTQEYPQTFEYAGSTISIDKVEVGMPTTIVISNHEVKNRAYESLHINVVGEDEHAPSSMGMETEGVLVDKNGVIYDSNTTSFSYDEIEEPRHFETVQILRLDANNMVPKRLDISGYNTTKYLNDVVKISLE
ncbi:sigma-70 family RNA polymerase sigma factor [Robertmurraya korlensis]|uniref:sigma-70 family RNA polymerase sigma factor n=1 Tax=Robertmurraya korlensis TaxID=519977 RepID=UPI00203F37FD|nr:sigma-70 family RNA polymerase sigma factor [Robertmurraya korlensis]MCM3602765.1 sigma-70 family RNA polymerase sigma factor [Robertmurraya korlensis]